MVSLPKPRPPRMCILCNEIIDDNLDAHIGPCGDTGKPHVLFSPTPYLTWPRNEERHEQSS